MKSIHNERPVIGIGVCVIKEGKVLLGKRKSSHGNGCWSFPGGHLEKYESWFNCAIREVREESGLKIKNLNFAGLTNDIFPEAGKHYVTIFIIADHDYGDPEIMEPEKCYEWNWFTWECLPEPLFLPIINLIGQGFHPLKITTR
jgi:8-oxo-dGTP diphosphatase